MNEKLPNSKVAQDGGPGSSWFFFGAKEVIRFIGVAFISVITIGIVPAIVDYKKNKK